jgi:hypothetical protein
MWGHREHLGSLSQLRVWEWTLSYRTPRSLTESASLQASQDESVQATTVKENKSKLEASLAAIALATNTNPTKILGSDKLLPRLQQMIDGFRKVDPPTTKQLPVEADVPEFLVQLGLSPEARELDRAIGDLTMIAFYYLLRIGEYTTKGTRTIRNRRRNLKWEISPSLPKIRKATFAASLGMLQRTSSQQQKEPP